MEKKKKKKEPPHSPDRYVNFLWNEVEFYDNIQKSHI